MKRSNVQRVCESCGELYYAHYGSSKWTEPASRFCSKTCMYKKMRKEAILKNGEYDGIPLKRQKNGRIRIRTKPIKFLYVYTAEKALGRPLPKGAVVHHIDGNPYNDSPNNLVILQSHKEHMVLHAKMDLVSKGGIPGKHLWCPQCLQVKVLEDFGYNAANGWRGYKNNICKLCVRLKAREKRKILIPAL